MTASLLAECRREPTPFTLSRGFDERLLRRGPDRLYALVHEMQYESRIFIRFQRLVGHSDPVSVVAPAARELISFGFWPGDQKVREPTFYSYAAPEPTGLAGQPLRPGAASWQQPYGESHFAPLPYEAVRTSDDPRETLLVFLQSAYDAGATLAGWDRDALRSTWCPPFAALG